MNKPAETMSPPLPAPPGETNPTAKKPSDGDIRIIVGIWSNPKLPFNKDESEFLLDKAGKDIETLQKLAKSLLRANPINNTLLVDPTYLKSEEAKPKIEKILKLNEKIQNYRDMYLELKEISEVAGVASIAVTPLALFDGVSELLQGHPGAAALAAVMVIPGGKLVAFLKKAKAGEEVIKGAEKVAKLEEKLQNAGKGSTEFAQLEKELAEEREELQNLLKDSATTAGKLPAGIREYIRDVEQQTGRTIPQNQIGNLKDALRSKKYSKLPEADAALNRVEFEKVKNKLIVDWERETGQTWPRYTEDLMTKDGTKVARKKGSAYDAHHIIENELGGPAEWWNIHPAKFPGEHQGGIHGSGSPLRQLIQNIE